jgi:hypothetical protein
VLAEARWTPGCDPSGIEQEPSYIITDLWGMDSETCPACLPSSICRLPLLGLVMGHDTRNNEGQAIPMSDLATGYSQDLPFEYADQVWFAIDSLGQLALFSSARIGPWPHYYGRRRTMAKEQAAQALKMPEIGGYEIVKCYDEGATGDAWLSLSERGLYTYDFDTVVGSGYGLYSLPETPLILPEEEFYWRLSTPRFSGVFGKEKFRFLPDEILSWTLEGIV